jgi:hypothetical protein
VPKHEVSSIRSQVVYLKLLKAEASFAHLEDAQPTLAKGLQTLLDYPSDDVEDVFGLSFEVEYSFFDTVRP